MDPEAGGPSQDEIGLPDDSGDRANAAILQGMAEGVQSKDTTPLTPEQQARQVLMEKVEIADDQMGGFLVDKAPMKDGSHTLLFTASYINRVGYRFAFGVNSLRGMVRTSPGLGEQLTQMSHMDVRVPDGLQINSVDLSDVSERDFDLWRSTLQESKDRIINDKAKRELVAKSRLDFLNKGITAVSAPIDIGAASAPRASAEAAAVSVSA